MSDYDTNNVQLVIPMAGSSKMFADVGYVGPKWLIDIDDKPMIQHVIEQFPKVEDILFICNEEEIQNPEVINLLESLGGKVVGIAADSNGPVETILRVSDYISDEKEVIISYCDHGMVWDFPSFLEEVRRDNLDGAITCYRDFHPHLIGTTGLYTFCLHKNNRLLEVQDKEPFTEVRNNEFISSDIFYFRSGRLLKEYFRKNVHHIGMNGFVAQVFNLMLTDNLDILVHEIDAMLLWATPEDLKTYKRWSMYFSKNRQSINNSDFTLILPMSGNGTRFSQEGYTLPKPLLPIDGVPMFAGVVDCLPGHKDNVFICQKKHDAHDIIKSYYPEAKVKVIDHVTEGFADSCRLGLDYVDENSPIMVSPCDNGVSYDEEEFLRCVADDNNDVIIWSIRDSQATKVNPSMYTWLYVDQNNYLSDMVYKQVPESDLSSTHVSIGIMYFKKAKYLLEGYTKNREQNIRPTGELCMDSVATQLAKSGYTVKVFEVDHYACWGTPDDYKTYNYWEEHLCQKTKTASD